MHAFDDIFFLPQYITTGKSKQKQYVEYLVTQNDQIKILI